MSLGKLAYEVHNSGSNASKEALCKALIELDAPDVLAIGTLRLLMQRGIRFRPREVPTFEELSKKMHKTIVKWNNMEDQSIWDKHQIEVDNYLTVSNVIDGADVADINNLSDEEQVTVALLGITDEQLLDFKKFESVMQP